MSRHHGGALGWRPWAATFCGLAWGAIDSVTALRPGILDVNATKAEAEGTAQTYNPATRNPLARSLSKGINAVTDAACQGTFWAVQKAADGAGTIVSDDMQNRWGDLNQFLDDNIKAQGCAAKIDEKNLVELTRKIMPFATGALAITPVGPLAGPLVSVVTSMFTQSHAIEGVRAFNALKDDLHEQLENVTDAAQNASRKLKHFMLRADIAAAVARGIRTRDATNTLVRELEVLRKSLLKACSARDNDGQKASMKKIAQIVDTGNIVGSFVQRVMETDRDAGDVMAELNQQVQLILHDAERNKDLDADIAFPLLEMVDQMLDTWVMLASDRYRLLSSTYLELKDTGCHQYAVPILDLNVNEVPAAWERYRGLYDKYMQEQKPRLLEKVVDAIQRGVSKNGGKRFSKTLLTKMMPTIMKVYRSVMTDGGRPNAEGGAEKKMRELLLHIAAAGTGHHKLVCGASLDLKTAAAWFKDVRGWICREIPGSRTWASCAGITTKRPHISTCTHHCCCDIGYFYDFADDSCKSVEEVLEPSARGLENGSDSGCQC
eukprot:TRINITY_DN36431_c0_g1_i1.p1 TRINITY_DN36431_c0_g1~~TRINITY_DN36431_c0_g1_i1.p1  ORF type:complete len:548 (-),score=125.51 TRINITY_DN36431_c0_g1_i1:63-1706(-)